MTFTLSGAPAGAVITSGGVFTWTPTEVQGPGVYVFTVVVTDDGTPNLNDSETITVTVNEVNTAPVLDPVGDQTIDEETLLTFTATASDVDLPPDTLTFTLSGAPAGAVITSGGVFTWTPTEVQGPGVYVFTVVVTDDGTPNLNDSETIRIKVDNRPPVAVDDLLFLDEDTAETFDVTSNDSDPDGDSLNIVSVSQPSEGTVIVAGPGTVFYLPPLNFWGTTSFTYTVSDGAGGEATATVFVDVASVNDAPLARADEYRLTNYLAANLDVLDNDSDIDGDLLHVVLGTLPAIGQAESDGNHIAYTPESGWVGTVTFSYFAIDETGARAETTVAVIISEDVLTGARSLARELGVANLPFSAPSAQFDATELSLLDLQIVTLLAEAFFQTLESLRLPLSFLGLALIVTLALGMATKMPILLIGSRQRYWGVVLRDREQGLPVYLEPAGDKIIYNFDPTTNGIISIGKPQRLDSIEWLQVDTPNGTGWVKRQYLTEQVDLEAFISDRRPIDLVNQLAKKLRRSQDVNSLLSRSGLIIALTEAPARVSSNRLAGLVGKSRIRHIRTLGSTADGEDDLLAAVTGPFLEAYDATDIVNAETPHSTRSLIPTECWNFPYLALGNGEDVQPWLVFFEYRRGKAWITGLGIDE